LIVVSLLPLQLPRNGEKAPTEFSGRDRPSPQALSLQQSSHLSLSAWHFGLFSPFPPYALSSSFVSLLPDHRFTRHWVPLAWVPSVP
jgi:hypothetical protein